MGFDETRDVGCAVAVAGQKGLDRFRVGEVEASASGHEKLARGRGHAFEDGDAETVLAQDFGGGQACGAGPYDGDVFQEEECFLFRLGGEAYHVLMLRMEVQGSSVAT